MEDLQLTEKEIKEIKGKRANDLKLVVKNKTKEAIEYAKEKVVKFLKEDKEKVEAYQRYFSELNLASMSKSVGSFELIIEEYQHEELPFFYKEGSERVNLPLETGTAHNCRIKYIGETVKHEYYVVDEDGDKSSYYGDTPEKDGAFRVDAKYSVTLEEHISSSHSGYVKTSQGLKMTLNGLEYCRGERRDVGKRLTNPKTIIKKIQEDIQLRKDLIAREDASKSLLDRAKQELKEFFPDGKISELDRRLIVRFKNGSAIWMRYYDNEDSPNGVEFATEKLDAPSGSNPITLGHMLKDL